MTEALVHVDPSKRTAVTFQVQGDPWPVIGAWAKKHRFMPRAPQTGPVKLFQKGSGLFTSPVRAQFTQHAGGTIELQAWLSIPFLARLGALFLLPAEMHIRSGGFKGVVPRKIARTAVNDLLAQVGATPVP